MEILDNLGNPLVPFDEVPPHPSVSAETIEYEYESSISSMFSSLNLGENLKAEALHGLERYARLYPSNDTSNLLRAFIDHLPTKGQLVLVAEIAEHANNPGKLRMLRNFLVGAILKPRIPPPPPPNSVKYMATIESSSRNEQSQLRRDCLKRDDHRCVVGGIVDRKHFFKLSPAIRQGRRHGEVHASHILPFALSEFNENNALEVRKKATIWWALYRYFPIIGSDTIGASTINKCENAIILFSAIHGDFGKFGSHSNRSARYIKSEITAFIPPAVTFRQYNPTIPMPNPNLLRGE
ncbi:hypothetical protein B0H67DRAFT_477314 [Lasiosphaeris hirsuta]|uniref:HNH nuclease domain-containing protein n=1 Tax=Lasiosphaeris hirsuta TaxID=260670 RepID=A0AA40B9U6_9PEZI|nr:hypothetical protein B0H67DRAFT_477314 [Lasiosphaeris hirsuta]